MRQTGEEKPQESGSQNDDTFYEQLNELSDVLSFDGGLGFRGASDQDLNPEAGSDQDLRNCDVTSYTSSSMMSTEVLPTGESTVNEKSSSVNIAAVQQTPKVKPKKKRKPKISIYKHVPHCEREPHVVEKRNARERKRVMNVNKAFLHLRKHVPCGKRNKHISKAKILKIAIDYIYYLQDLIDLHENHVDVKELEESAADISDTSEAREVHVKSISEAFLEQHNHKYTKGNVKKVLCTSTSKKSTTLKNEAESYQTPAGLSSCGKSYAKTITSTSEKQYDCNEELLYQNELMLNKMNCLGLCTDAPGIPEPEADGITRAFCDASSLMSFNMASCPSLSDCSSALSCSSTSYCSSTQGFSSSFDCTSSLSSSSSSSINSIDQIAELELDDAYCDDVLWRRPFKNVEQIEAYLTADLPKFESNPRMDCNSIR